MKLPYQAGDIIGLPLGDGRTARAQIAAVEHRIVVLRAFDPEGASIATLRVTDDALVLHRWKRIERAAAPRASVEAENPYWMHAAQAERIVARRLGVAVPPERSEHIIEIRDDAIPAVESVAEGTTLAWLRPLGAQSLARVRAIVEAVQGVRVSIGDGACHQAKDISSWPLTRLSLAGECSHLQPNSRVRELELHAHVPLQFFPRLTTLRLLGKRHFDAHNLLCLSSLKVLEMSSVAITHPARFLNLPALQTLRCSRTTGLEKARHVALPGVKALSLHETGELADIWAIKEMPVLHQLELDGFWQQDIPSMEWLVEMKTLERAEIDIGGRRKNVELYRRTNWAYPWPL